MVAPFFVINRFITLEARNSITKKEPIIIQFKSLDIGLQKMQN